MLKLLQLLSILLLFSACTTAITRNIYKVPINRYKLQNEAFQNFADIYYKDGTVSSTLFTKVTEDSITIVNLNNKNIDPVIKTIPLTDIKSIIIFEEDNSDCIVYTFEKPEK